MIDYYLWNTWNGYLFALITLVGIFGVALCFVYATWYVTAWWNQRKYRAAALAAHRDSLIRYARQRTIDEQSAFYRDFKSEDELSKTQH